jgi:tripartite-type tricarboxylate transporter receptor subunit TctC
MLNRIAGIALPPVPYTGAAPALLDVLAGNEQLLITSPIAAGAHMRAGRVRALATTGAQRNPALPELPTIADAVPGYEISQSWGVVAPTGTPPAVQRRLNEDIVKAMGLPDMKDRVLKTGAVPAGDQAAEFGAFMARERQRLGEVIAKSGIVLAN